MQPLELLFRFAIMTGVLDGMAFGVGIVGEEADIDAHLFASGNMLDLALCLYRELTIVAISPMHNPYALDLLGRKGCNLLVGIANQSEPPNTTPISETYVLAIRLKLPTCLLVLY